MRLPSYDDAMRYAWHIVKVGIYWARHIITINAWFYIIAEVLCVISDWREPDVTLLVVCGFLTLLWPRTEVKPYTLVPPPHTQPQPPTSH